jgi:hypothetical protein
MTKEVRPMKDYLINTIKTLRIGNIKGEAILSKYQIDVGRIYNISDTILESDLKNHIAQILFLIVKHKDSFSLYIGEAHLNKTLKKLVKEFKYLEIRFLGKFKGKKQFFIDISNLQVDNISEKAEEIVELVKRQYKYIKKQKNSRVDGIHIGIAPRRAERGDSRASTAWSYIPFDFDIEEWKTDKMPTEEEIAKKTVEYLVKFVEKGIYPHKVAFTGGGLRFYIYTERAVLEEELLLLKRIAEELGADIAMYDLARVDRLVGTYNYKEKYGSPRPCISIAWIKDEEDINKLVSPIILYKKFGIINEYEEFKALFEEQKEELDNKKGLNNINTTIKRLSKKQDVNKTILNDIDEKTYKWLRATQAKLTEKLGKRWIEKMLSYLNLDYKYGRNGDRIDLWSLFYDDGKNPDCSIYINQGYNTVMVDFHDPNMRFIALAGLWMVKEFRDKIIEFLKLYNINPEPAAYRSVREIMNELLNKETIKIEAEGHLPKEAIIKAYELSIEKGVPVFLKADTGRGKTYNLTRFAREIKDEFGKDAIAALFPYKIQVLQVGAGLHAEGVEVAMYYEDGQKLSKNTIHYLVLGTYDQVENVFKDLCWDSIKGEKIQIREEEDILLAIDEAHDLIIQKEFRKRAIGTVRKYVNLAGGCILLTATPELVNLNNYPVIEVEFKDKRKLFERCSIHVARNIIGEFCEYILQMFNCGEVRNALVLVDNKKMIENIKYTLELYGFKKPIYIITRETVGTDKASKMIIEKEKIPKKGLVLATRVISEGVNIKNRVDLVWALYCKSATTIRQFIARCRNGGKELIVTAPLKEKDEEPMIIDYKAMIEMFKENYNLLRQFLEADIEVLKGLDKKYKKVIISKIQNAIYYDEEKKEWVLDEDELAHIYNSMLEAYITRNYQLLKEYLEKTTGYKFAIKTIKELEETKLDEFLRNKYIEYIEKVSASHVIKAFKEYGVNKIKNALEYNNYEKFKNIGDEYTPQLIKRHSKRINRVINVLKDIYSIPETIEVYNQMLKDGKNDKLNIDESTIKKCLGEIKEYRKIVKEINEKEDRKTKKIYHIDLKLLEEHKDQFPTLVGITEELVLKTFLCSPSKWGKIQRITRAVWNIAVGEEDERLNREKLGLKSLTAKVLVKVRDFALVKTKFKIRELMEVIREESGFNLTLEEARRVLRAIFNCVIRGVKKLGDNAVVEVKELNKEFKMLYEIIKQDINSNSVEKCEKVIEEKIKENGEEIYETEQPESSRGYKRNKRSSERI